MTSSAASPAGRTVAGMATCRACGDLFDRSGSWASPPRVAGGARRRPRDFYETAPWQVDALTDHVPELSGAIWEPCVGDGSLLAQLLGNRPDLGPIITNDIDPTRPADYHLDATRADSWREIARQHGPPHWVVTNPPFRVAFEILQHAVTIARTGVILMVRVSFSEPTAARGPWLAAHPSSKRITLERWSFTGNGHSDSATTEWLIWANVALRPPFGISAFGYKSGRGRR